LKEGEHFAIFEINSIALTIQVDQIADITNPAVEFPYTFDPSVTVWDLLLA